MLSASEAAQKWAQNLGRSADAYKQGIQRTAVNPMEEAAKNVDGYLNGVQQAVSSGKYQAGLRRVSKEEWMRKSMDLGASRLAAGANAAQGKMQSFLQDFLPVLQANRAQVQAMPKATTQDRIQRAVRMMELNAQYKRGK